MSAHNKTNIHIGGMNYDEISTEGVMSSASLVPAKEMDMYCTEIATPTHRATTKNNYLKSSCELRRYHRTCKRRCES